MLFFMRFNNLRHSELCICLYLLFYLFSECVGLGVGVVICVDVGMGVGVGVWSVQGHIMRKPFKRNAPDEGSTVL